MNAIISLCIGIVCLAAGNDISELMQLAWISIICDIIGGCFIGLGCKKFSENKKQDSKNIERVILTLKELSDKIITENEWNYIKDKIDSVNDTQNKMLMELSSESQILEEYITTYKKSIIENNQLQETGIKKVTTSINELKDSMVETYKSAESLLSKQEQTVLKLRQDVDAIKTEIENSSDMEREHIDNLAHELEEIKRIPQEVLDMLDEYMEKINKQGEGIEERFDYLSDDLTELEKKRIDSLKKIMKQIQEYNEDCNNHVAEQIGKLCNQYEQFKDLSSEMIKQMTLMSQSDIEIMKGLLNE